MATNLLAIQIPELPALLKKLHALGDKKLANAAFRKGLRKGAKLIAGSARPLAPMHDGPYPPHRVDRAPGTLRKTIKVRAIKRTRKGVGVRVSDYYTGQGYYGAFQEYGTKHQKATPYLRPSFDKHKGEAVTLLKAEIKSAVEVAFAKGGKRK